MNHKLLRGFFGAFLCAFIGVMVGATWQIEWLAILGAVFGWAFGYHGDRIISGFVIGWQNTKARGKLRIKIKEVSALKKKISGLQETLTFLGYFIAKVFKLIINLLLLIIKSPVYFYEFFIKAPDYFSRKYKEFTKWLNRGLLNKAKFIRGALVTIVAFVGFVYAYNIISTNSVQIGEFKKTYKNNMVEVSAFDYYTENITLSIFAVAFTIGILSIFYFKEGRSNKGKTLIRKRMRRGVILFTLGELFRLAWITILLTLFVAISATYGFGGIFVLVLPSVAISAIAIMVLKITYVLIKIQKDYGLASLIIGILTGIITYYWFYDLLTVSLYNRLGISALSGFVAGLISVVYIKVFEIGFRKIHFFKLVAKANPENGEMFDLLTLLPTIVWGNVLKYLWVRTKKIMPAYTTNFKF